MVKIIPYNEFKKHQLDMNNPIVVKDIDTRIMLSRIISSKQMVDEDRNKNYTYDNDTWHAHIITSIEEKFGEDFQYTYDFIFKSDNFTWLKLLFMTDEDGEFTNPDMVRLVFVDEKYVGFYTIKEFKDETVFVTPFSYKENFEPINDTIVKYILPEIFKEYNTLAMLIHRLRYEERFKPLGFEIEETIGDGALLIQLTKEKYCKN